MKAIYFLAAVAVMFSLGLSAEEMQSRASFQQLDKDRDGYVSIIEATGQTQLLRQWTSVDRDTDGKLEEAEFSAFEVAPSMTFEPVVNPDEAEIGAAPTN